MLLKLECALKSVEDCMPVQILVQQVWGGGVCISEELLGDADNSGP